MRSVDPVEVTWAILHRVAPGPSGLELSPRELPLTSELSKFLANHIENGLADGGVRAAQFQSSDPRAVVSQCRALVAETGVDRILASQSVATALHVAMGSDGRIKAGGFVIALHRLAGDQRDRVALVKLDPGPGFRLSTATDGTGQRFQTVVLVRDALPSTKEKLQKCAFIQLDPTGAAELLVLDRQVDAASADFFLSGFLSAELINTNAVLTERLDKALASAYNDLVRNHPETAEVFREARDGLLATDHVDLDAWLGGLNIEQREAVERSWGEAEPDRSFDIDKTGLARRKLQRFLGDYGLQIAVDPEYAQAMLTVLPIEGTEPALFRITIETHRWEQRA